MLPGVDRRHAGQITEIGNTTTLWIIHLSRKIHLEKKRFCVSREESMISIACGVCYKYQGLTVICIVWLTSVKLSQISCFTAVYLPSPIET